MAGESDENEEANLGLADALLSSHTAKHLAVCKRSASDAVTDGCCESTPHTAKFLRAQEYGGPPSQDDSPGKEVQLIRRG
jgi:hypothetical protein